MLIMIDNASGIYFYNKCNQIILLLINIDSMQWSENMSPTYKILLILNTKLSIFLELKTDLVNETK